MLFRSRSGSWLVAARRTYYDAIASKIVDQSFPGFNDIQTKVAWDLTDATKLSAFGLRSRQFGFTNGRRGPCRRGGVYFETRSSGMPAQPPPVPWRLHWRPARRYVLSPRPAGLGSAGPRTPQPIEGVAL